MSKLNGLMGSAELPTKLLLVFLTEDGYLFLEPLSTTMD